MGANSAKTPLVLPTPEVGQVAAVGFGLLITVPAVVPRFTVHKIRHHLKGSNSCDESKQAISRRVGACERFRLHGVPDWRSGPLYTFV